MGSQAADHTETLRKANEQEGQKAQRKGSEGVRRGPKTNDFESLSITIYKKIFLY